MKLLIKNFGDVLMSRPAGKEAVLFSEAYLLKTVSSSEEIILDFSEVKVLTPSWLDEFLTGLKNKYKNKIDFLHTENPSVKASLKTVLE
jgi:hypothetical protein